MKKLIRLVFLLAIFCFTMATFTGCMRSYDKPTFKDIAADETAFKIPLIGNTSDQAVFKSEDLLKQAEIATKRVQIAHVWVQTGRADWNGEYMDAETIVTVKRTPETRDWTESTNTGTSGNNQAIGAESKESIGFTAQMNCSAQIDEANAAKFLYSYNSEALADIMDKDIRERIASDFVEQCALYNLADLLNNKANIMDYIRKDCIAYFATKGITITMIGISDQFTYKNDAIQKAIDAKYASAQEVITQKNENEKNVSKAEADRQVIETQSATIEKSLELKRLENQAAAIAKWDGKMPSTTVSGTGTALFDIPTGTN